MWFYIPYAIILAIGLVISPGITMVVFLATAFVWVSRLKDEEPRKEEVKNEDESPHV